jgi:hypothetical protein
LEKKFYAKWLLGSLILLLVLTGPGLLAQSDSLAKVFEQVKAQAYEQLAEDPDSAYRLMEEARAQARRAGLWNSYAALYNHLSMMKAQDESHFWEAIHSAREARDSIAFHLSEAAPAYADALANLAYFNRRSGRLEAAQGLYQQAIGLLYEQQANPPPESLSRLYYLLATTSFMEGDWLAARDRFEKAMEIWTEAGSPYFAHITQCYLHLGLVYRKLEAWEKSRPYYRACLHYYYPHIRIEAGYGLAWTFVETGLADSAQKYLDHARAQQVQDQPYLPQMGWEIQGKIHALGGKGEAALEAFRKAQQLRIRLYPYRFEDLARGKQALARQFAEMGSFDSAAFHLQKGLAHLQLPDAPSTQGLIFPQWALPIYIQLGDCYHKAYAQRGQDSLFQASLAAYEQAYTLLHSLREDRAEEAGKLLLTGYNQQLTEQVFSLLLPHYQSHPDKGEAADPFLPWLWMERYQAGILYAARQRSEALLKAGLPDSLRRREQDLLASIGYLRIRMQEERHEDSLRLRQQQLFQQQERYRRFREELSQQWPIYDSTPTEIRLRKVRKALADIDKESGILAFFWGKEKTYLLAHQGETWQFTELGEKEKWEEDLRWMEDFLENPTYQRGPQQQFISRARRMYLALHQRAPSVTPCETLYLLPDGPLSRLPFEMLLRAEVRAAEEQPVSAAYRTLPYWSQSTQIAYAHSLQLLSKKPPIPAFRSGGLAVFAPVYEGLHRIKQNEELPTALLQHLAGESFGSQGKETFLTLGRDFSALHLSVHGYPNPESPGDAYLQFAPFDSFSERLYAHEIYNLELPASLLTLAACDGGEGKLIAGEGVLSLARAFRYAGAATVIQSRWQTDARVASGVFEKFYAALSRNTPSLPAFTDARNAWLATASPDLTHPHFWANFSHWGQNHKKPSFLWPFLAGAAFLLLSVSLLVFRKKIWTVGERQ